MKQIVGNACGSIAVIHAIANNKDLVEVSDDSPLGSFLSRTWELSPLQRGTLLGFDEGIYGEHKKAAKKGQTNAADHFASNFHFICFTVINDKLYELDGSKKRPISHGPCTRDQFLDQASGVIQRNFIDANPQDPFFSVITLGPSTGDEMQLEEQEEREKKNHVSELNLVMLVSMGFDMDQARTALLAANDDLETATAILTSS